MRVVLRMVNPSRGVDKTVDLSVMPLPTVGAQSCTIGNCCISHWWIETTAEDDDGILHLPVEATTGKQVGGEGVEAEVLP